MISKKGSIYCPFFVNLCLLFALKKWDISAFFCFKNHLPRVTQVVCMDSRLYLDLGLPWLPQMIWGRLSRSSACWLELDFAIIPRTKKTSSILLSSSQGFFFKTPFMTVPNHRQLKTLWRSNWLDGTLWKIFETFHAVDEEDAVSIQVMIIEDNLCNTYPGKRVPHFDRRR